MEKTESLEQAALTFFSEIVGYERDLTDEVWLKDAIRFAAERERQVWAEAAKIAEEPYSDEIRAFGPDEPSIVGEKIAAALRARGEQVK